MTMMEKKDAIETRMESVIEIVMTTNGDVIVIKKKVEMTTDGGDIETRTVKTPKRVVDVIEMTR